eukprot:TRINITY_DN1752_c0_g1_i1.p3 TRINITY_DN1752_c0_g1~~TRINITY_DN1752_c0_g1_i1.p3  ORF type:complete len:152 (+),score=0.86 TRINITY_DN1752_c0_g1_i1:769-1224(+)
MCQSEALLLHIENESRACISKPIGVNYFSRDWLLVRKYNEEGRFVFRSTLAQFVFQHQLYVFNKLAMMDSIADGFIIFFSRQYKQQYVQQQQFSRSDQISQQVNVEYNKFDLTTVRWRALVVIICTLHIMFFMDFHYYTFFFPQDSLFLFS